MYSCSTGMIHFQFISTVLFLYLGLISNHYTEKSADRQSYLRIFLRYTSVSTSAYTRSAAATTRSTRA